MAKSGILPGHRASHTEHRLHPGRRVRIADGGTLPDGPGADSLPWHEIVGVVKELGMTGAAESTRGLGLYLPATPGTGFAPGGTDDTTSTLPRNESSVITSTSWAHRQ